MSVEIGAQAGLDGNDLRAKFATASRKMNNALAEIPFPDLEDLSKDDRRNFDEPPTGTPPKS